MTKMRGGNVEEFVDNIYMGQELVFLYKGQKFFLQGYCDKGSPNLYLDRWDPPGNDYIWVGKGSKSEGYPVDEFLEQKLWDSRSFWEAQDEMEWIDC